ncbi:Protein TusB [Carnimonas sp. R-84981]|uniref:sulfurtransferase complex subunit TusB n=1 Tax=Carnimonas bestiolae TaxID=3402172 RepID=UPI003EDC1264
MLHLVCRSPYADPALFERLLDTLDAEATVLLIEDGVLGASGRCAERLAQSAARCCVLREDLAARGLLEHCHEALNLVDISAFVELTARYPASLSWY